MRLHQAQQPGGPQVPGGRGPGRSKGHQECRPGQWRPPEGEQGGDFGLGGHFALNARLKAKPEHKIDRELASHLPAGLPMGVEVGWVLLLARVPMKTEEPPLIFRNGGGILV